MSKEEFIEYVKKLTEMATSVATGDTELEKAKKVIEIIIAESKLTALYSKHARNLTVEQADKFVKLFSQEEQTMFRRNLINGLGVYFSKNGIKISEETNHEFALIKQGLIKIDYNKVEDLIGQYLSKDEYEKLFDNFLTEGHPGYYDRTFMISELEEALRKKGLSNDDIKKLNLMINERIIPTVEEIHESLKGLVPEEELKNNPMFHPVANIPYKFMLKNENVLNFILETSSEKQFDEMVNAAEEKKFALDKPKNEVEVLRYPSEAQAMRDSGLTKEQEEALQYIEDNTKKGTEAFDSDLEKLRPKYEAAINKDNERIGNSIIKENGLDVIGTEFIVTPKKATPYYVLDKSKPKDKIKEFHDAEMEFTQETKKALLDILHKMEDYGFSEDKIKVEEGAKIYGLTNLSKINKEIGTAMRNGEKDKLPELAKKLKEENEKIGEIFSDIEKHFPVHEGNLSYPGNVDVARNTYFTPEYRRNIATVSTFNGLYATLSFIKANNLTIEEFVDHPRKCGVEIQNKLLDLTEPTYEKFKGKSAGEVIHFMQQYTEMIGVNSGFTTGIGRVLESMQCIEKDPKQREKNHAVAQMYAYESNAFTTQLTERNNQRDNPKLFSRILLVNEEENRNYSLCDKRMYDGKNFALTQVKPFDDAEYLLKSEINIKNFNEKIKQSLKDYSNLLAEALKKDPNYGKAHFTMNDFIEMSRNTALEVLIAKNEEKDLPEFNALKTLVEDPKTYLKQVMQEKNFDINNLDNMKFGEKDGFVEGAEKHINNEINKTKNFGEGIVAFDVELNKTLKSTQKDIDKLTKDIEKLKRKKVDTTELEKQKADKEKELKEKVEKRKKTLQENFRKGKITEHYYKERFNQFDSKNFDDVPPMFLADKMPSKKEYLKNADLQDLTKEEQDLVYNNAVERANQAKRDFFKKEYMRKCGLIGANEENYTFEEMNPELKGIDKISNDKVTEVTEADLKKAEDAVINKPEEKNKQIGEKIHIDLDEKTEVKTKMIKNDTKTKQIDKKMEN